MRALVAVLAVIACGPSESPRETAEPDPRAPSAQRTAPAPAAVRFPVPPQQRAPWTGDPALPAVLLDAARTLFDQGFADPRGCAYRQIEIEVGNVWLGYPATVDTHGFAIPGQPYAVAWNGLVYPAVAIGAEVDLVADVAAMLAPPPQAPGTGSTAPPGPRRARHLLTREASSVMPDKGFPAALLLARLGEADLAAQVWQAIGYTPTRHGDLYGWIAEQWVWRMFDRAVGAHMRGADPLALESLQRLAAVQPVVEAAATLRGLPRQDPGTPYIDFLGPLPDLLADEQRRAARAPRAPLPDAQALARLPDAVQIAVLIDHLDEVAVPQISQPGRVELTADPIVDALIKAGAPAVEPLIEVLASDHRLTRSVHFWRDYAHERSVLGVHEAAYAALAAIFETSFFTPDSTGDDLTSHGMAGRKQVVDQIRAYWPRWRPKPRRQEVFDL